MKGVEHTKAAAEAHATDQLAGTRFARVAFVAVLLAGGAHDGIAQSSAIDIRPQPLTDQDPFGLAQASSDDSILVPSAEKEETGAAVAAWPRPALSLATPEREPRTGAEENPHGSKEPVEAKLEVLRPPVGNYEFLGAMEIHRHTNATPGVDDKIVHRLNTGGWEVSADGAKDVVDVNPMLDYGFVLDQSSSQPNSLDIDLQQQPVELYLGRPGKTTVIASHNVTTLQPAEAAVSVGDSSEYAHTRAMLSAYNEQQRASGEGDYRPNVSPNDQFVIRLNNPNNTQTVLSYRVRKILEPVVPDSPEFNAWYDPPPDPAESWLVIYWCWPPGSDGLRQAVVSVLESVTEVSSQVTYQGEQAPKLATAIR